jgi:hypothetical protein
MFQSNTLFLPDCGTSGRVGLLGGPESVVVRAPETFPVEFLIIPFLPRD